MIRTYGGTEEAELHTFSSQGKVEVQKRNFRSLEVLAEMKCGSGLIHIWMSWQNKCGRWTRSFEVLAKRKYRKRNLGLWQSRQSRSAEAELHAFGSPGRDEMRKWPYPYLDVLAEQSPGRAEAWKAEFQIFGCKDRAELRKQCFRPLKVLAGRMCGSWTSYLWQLRQIISAENELHIFWNHGRYEMRKRTYPILEVLAEQVRKMNEIFRSPGRAEVWKAELQIFGNQGRTGVRKRNFKSLEDPAEMKCGSGHPHLEVLAKQVRQMNEIFRSPGRAEVRKAELQIFGSKDKAELRKRSFRPLKVLAEPKCGSWTSDRLQPRQDRSAEAELHILRRIGRAEVWNGFHVTSLVVRQNGSAGAEFQVFGSPVKLEVWKQNFTSLSGPYPTDCHCQCWRMTLLTTIIVIPNEGQCEDQVWLKQRTFAMLLTRSLCSRRDSG